MTLRGQPEAVGMGPVDIGQVSNRPTNIKYVVIGYVKVGEGPVYAISRVPSPDGIGEEVTVTIATCPGHNEVFRSADAVGGLCIRCDHVMCRECIVESKCQFCHRPVCGICGKESWTGAWKCREC